MAPRRTADRRKVRVRVDPAGEISYSPAPMRITEPLPESVTDAIVEALADALVADYRQSRDDERVA